MKMMLVTFGTAGDVFPLLGVGRALQARGHEVHVASTPQYQAAAEGAGLLFHALEGIPGASDAPDFYHPTRSMRLVAERMLIPAVKTVYELLSSLNPAEWVIIANNHCLGARVAQEKLGHTLLTCVISPFGLASIQQMPVTPGLACPPWAPAFLRRAFYGFVARLWDRELAPSINGFRATLGLPPAKNIWYEWCLSPQRVIGLFPAAFAPNPSDWPRQFVHGGFTVFDQGVSHAFPEELRQPGPPLVVFAAGSAGQAAGAFFDAAISASSGQPWRAVLLTGSKGMAAGDSVPTNVYRYRYVPLSQLMPLSSLIVHHGGMGTISLAFSAGVPQIAVPLGHDQFDNAERLVRAGIGKRLLKPHDLAAQLRSLIEECLRDQALSARCRQLQQADPFDPALSGLCELIEAARVRPGDQAGRMS